MAGKTVSNFRMVQTRLHEFRLPPPALTGDVEVEAFGIVPVRLRVAHTWSGLSATIGRPEAYTRSRS